MMKNTLFLLFLTLSIFANASDFSGVVPSTSKADWKGNKYVETGSGPFGEKIILVTLPSNKNCAVLGGTLKAEQNKIYALDLTYRSNLQNSGRDRGAWILVNWSDSSGKNLESKYFVLDANSDWTKKRIQLGASPKNASVLNLQIRVQEREGYLALKFLNLKEINSKSSEKNISQEQIFLNSLEKVAEYTLVSKGEGKPILKGENENLEAVYSSSNNLPAEFILPEKYCENEEFYYVIKTKIRYTREPRENAGGVFQLGLNMNGARTNSIGMVAWGNSTFFLRVTGEKLSSVAQVTNSLFRAKKEEAYSISAVVGANSIWHFNDGKLLGKSALPLRFMWSKNDKFFLGSEARNSSVFPGEIEYFSLGVYRKPFEFSAKSDLIVYGENCDDIVLNIKGKFPNNANISATLSDDEGGYVATLKSRIENNNIYFEIPKNLKYGWYSFDVEVNGVLFNQPYVFLPKKARRTLPEKSMFGGCQGIAMNPKDYAPAHVERMMKKLADSGMRHFRFWLHWSDLADENGNYNWEALDHLVSCSAKNGISLYPILNSGKYAYQKILPKAPYYVIEGIYPPLDAWARHVEAIALRYKNKILNYQIFNEAETRCNYYPFDAKLYVDLLKVSYPIFKNIDKNIKVGLSFCAALSGQMRTKTSHTPNDSAWGAAEFYALNPHPYYDIVDMHRYSSDATEQSWDSQYQDAKDANKYLQSVGESAKPVWNSETGFVIGTAGRPAGWNVYNVVSPHMQAVRILQWYIQSSAAKIERNFLFLPINDDAGLYNSAMTPNPSFAAYVNMVNNLTDTKFESDYNFNLKSKLRLYRFNKGEKTLVYAWTTSGTELLALEAKKPVRVYDMWGNISNNNAKLVSVGKTPVLFESKAAISLCPAIDLADGEIYTKSQAANLKINLTNPSDGDVEAELFFVGDNKLLAKQKVAIKANSKNNISVPLPVTPDKLEIGVKYSGGVNFESVVEKDLNPRELIDLRDAKIVSIKLNKKEQLHLGREVRDDQNRILSKLAWLGEKDVSATMFFKCEGDTVKFVLDVVDNAVIDSPIGSEPYLYDSLEIFATPKLDKTEVIQTVISANGNSKTYSKNKLKNFKYNTQRTPNGYKIFGSFERPAKIFGIDFALNDCDAIEQKRKSTLVFVSPTDKLGNWQSNALILTE